MDILSYQLGKKSAGGGGGGGSTHDWSKIGYSEEPKTIEEIYNYSKSIYDNWDKTKTNCTNLFDSDYSMLILPLIDTSNVTNMTQMFTNCRALREVPLIDTSNVTNFNGTFNYCQALELLGEIDTSNATNISSMFNQCTAIEKIHELDASKVDRVSGIFTGCNMLEDMGGLKNLGMAYSTTRAENYSYYTLSLEYTTALTHDSLMNIINDLYDIKTKGCNNQKLQLGATNYAKLSAEEIAIATNKGWNVVG